MNNIMDFTLEDIAGFIAWNEQSDRNGCGTQEMNDIVCNLIDNLGFGDEDVSKYWETINDTINKVFMMGMKAAARLQMQLLIGGAAQ